MALFQQLVNKNKIRFEALLALSVLVIGLVLSMMGFIELQAISKERLYLATEKYARTQVEQIQTKLDISLDSLKSVAALYSDTGDISKEKLAHFVETDTHYHAGTLGLAWAVRISHQDKSQFEHAMQSTGEHDFQIHEITGHGIARPVEGEQEYFPLRSLFPSRVGSLSLGLNIASMPSRLRVMNKAKKTQQTTITQHLSIFNNKKVVSGFQAFHPVFDEAQAWKKQLLGFVIGVYNFNALFADSFVTEHGQLNIALYDGNSSSQQLLYSSSDELTTVDGVKLNASPHWSFPIIVADKQWLLAVFPQSSTNISQTWLPYIGLFSGGLITLLLTIYLFISLVKSRQVTELSTDLAGTTSQLEIQRQLKIEADKANMAKSQLLRAASHDLRQPLHTIGLLTGLLAETKDHHQQQHLTHRITQAVEGMNEMFGALLDMSLLESGSLQGKNSHFYLQTVFDKLATEIELQLKHKSLELVVVQTSACVFTDQTLFEQIVRNYLSNALRYTEHGKIVLGCRRMQHTIRVCVIDTGIGMSEQSQAQLFDEFYRDEQAKQLSDKGLGLGLSIVAKTAEVLELNTGFRTQLNKGSQFYVDVPYGDQQWVKNPLPEVDVLASLHKTIWVIEDDEDVRFGMEQLLNHWGCAVVTIASSDELTTILAQAPILPDKVVADYQLINETGLSLVQRIYDHFEATVPTLFITGTTDSDAVEKVQAFNADLMMKPVKSSDLYLWSSHR